MRLTPLLHTRASSSDRTIDRSPIHQFQYINHTPNAFKSDWIARAGDIYRIHHCKRSTRKRQKTNLYGWLTHCSNTSVTHFNWQSDRLPRRSPRPPAPQLLTVTPDMFIISRCTSQLTCWQFCFLLIFISYFYLFIAKHFDVWKWVCVEPQEITAATKLIDARWLGTLQAHQQSAASKRPSQQKKVCEDWKQKRSALSAKQQSQAVNKYAQTVM